MTGLTGPLGRRRPLSSKVFCVRGGHVGDVGAERHDAVGVDVEVALEGEVVAVEHLSQVVDVGGVVGGAVAEAPFGEAHWFSGGDGECFYVVEAGEVRVVGGVGGAVVGLGASAFLRY